MAETAQKTRVVLSISELKKDINERGLTRTDLVKKYGLNRSQLKRALEQAGLKDQKAKKIDFTLVDDIVTDAVAPTE